MFISTHLKNEIAASRRFTEPEVAPDGGTWSAQADAIAIRRDEEFRRKTEHSP